MTLQHRGPLATGTLRSAVARVVSSQALFAGLVLSVTACGGGTTANPTPPTPPSRSTLVPSTTGGFLEARTSQITQNGTAPAAVFDDFTFTSAATVRTVAWQGIFCVETPGAAAPAPTASAFTVSIYPDVAGRPNIAAPVQTSTYPLAQANQVFEKNQAGLVCGTAANTTWPFYRYSVTLATPFNAVVGARYWISIQATTPSYAVFYGWRDGTVDNRLSLQLFQGTYTTFNVDRAYALNP